MTTQPITPNGIRMLNWNIKSGGFNSYDPSLETPAREAAIMSTITDQRDRHDVDTVLLTDAYRWDETYASESGIATHLGFQAARFVRPEDQRLDEIGRNGVGIAFATDHEVATSRALDLEDRQGLGAVLHIGKHGLQIAGVYLDDMSEDARLRQACALLADLEPDIPTLIVGDFNALRPDMKGAPLHVRTRDLGVRALSLAMPRKGYLGSAIRSMNERRVMSFLTSHGFYDADASRKRPTAPAAFPIFGLDYALHDSRVSVDRIAIVDPRGASDHWGVSFGARVE